MHEMNESLATNFCVSSQFPLSPKRVQSLLNSASSLERDVSSFDDCTTVLDATSEFMDASKAHTVSGRCEGVLNLINGECYERRRVNMEGD